MDIERQNRTELITALGSSFRCFEEVTLEHATFTDHKIRADVVAIPADERLSEYALAFEVKCPDQSWHYAKWSQVFRQASDYVYAKIGTTSNAAEFAGRRIAGAFIFPSPPYRPEGKGKNVSPYLRPENEEVFAGVAHLGLHLRIGLAGWSEFGNHKNFELRFGPNPVWSQKIGFKKQGISLLSGKRSLGSRRIDFKSELDGFPAR